MAVQTLHEPTTQTSTTPKDEALRLISAAHLHQSLWLPSTPTRPPLRVTYSTTSNFTTSPKLPVLLVCPPMFGGRYMTLSFEPLARKYGVRVVCADRPGMGGSTAVPLSQRIPTFLETVPVLLETLGVAHMTLVSHSAGTLYALNALDHLRKFLDPASPSIALVAPWVHSTHSSATLATLASAVPTGAIDSFNSVVGFINQSIAPSLSWSSGVVSSSTGLLTSRFSSDETASATPGETYGTSEAVGKELASLVSKFFFAEDTTAGNEDAKLCLKKGGKGSWGCCEDYEGFVRSVVGREGERRGTVSEEGVLRVRAFFAESDALIGKGGQEYFDRCWRQEGVEGWVRYEGRMLPGTDHDSVMGDVKKGALATIFAEVGRKDSTDSVLGA